jgi:hypothetical protein
MLPFRDAQFERKRRPSPDVDRLKARRSGHRLPGYFVKKQVQERVLWDWRGLLERSVLDPPAAPSRACDAMVDEIREW